MKLFGRRGGADASDIPVDDPMIDDPTGWMIDSSLAQVFLFHTIEIKYMAMFGYCFLNGAKMMPSFSATDSVPYRLINLAFKCTGGGILVPLFVNAIPVTLALDAYPIAILASFLLHYYFPILADIVKLSSFLKVALIVLFEMNRGYVVTSLTAKAASVIAPTLFDIAIFGPIICGGIAGCGGAFLPLSKGLDPIKTGGLGQPMWSALVAATFYHLFVNTSLSDGVIDAPKKAHLVVTIFFILSNIYDSLPALVGTTKKPDVKVKGEDKKTK